MKRPRILYICDLNLRNGGAQRITFDTLECLSRYFNFVIYTDSDIPDDSLKLLNKLNIPYIIDHSLNEDTITHVIHDYNIDSLLIQWENIGWLTLAASLASKLSIRSIALVHELPYIHTPTSRFIKNFKALVLLKLFKDYLKGNLYDIKTLHAILNVGKAVKKMTTLICVGDASRYYYKRYLGVDCIRIMPSVTIPGEELMRSNGYYNTFSYDVVFMSARHEPEKGIFDVVKIVKIVKEMMRRDLRVAIMGKFLFRNVESKFYSLLRKYHLKDDFEVLGFVAESAKYSVLRRSKVFLYPSSKDVFSISLAEALAMGTPAVVYDLPFTRMYNIGGVYKVKYKDIKGMAQKVREIIELSEKYPDKYLALRKQVSEYVRKTFTLERTCSELREVIDKALRE